jgi:hypothetical protein
MLESMKLYTIYRSVYGGIPRQSSKEGWIDASAQHHWLHWQWLKSRIEFNSLFEQRNLASG